jgi:hypothetical protein
MVARRPVVVAGTGVSLVPASPDRPAQPVAVIAGGPGDLGRTGAGPHCRSTGSAPTAAHRTTPRPAHPPTAASTPPRSVRGPATISGASNHFDVGWGEVLGPRWTRRARSPSLAVVSWEIRANLGRYVRAGVDAHGWRWEITRGAQVAQVVVEISGTAWSSDPLRLPDDTRGALQTDGRTELLKVLEQEDPPHIIRCGCSGCSYLSADEGGQAASPNVTTQASTPGGGR